MHRRFTFLSPMIFDAALFPHIMYFANQKMFIKVWAEGIEILCVELVGD